MKWLIVLILKSYLMMKLSQVTEEVFASTYSIIINIIKEELSNLSPRLPSSFILNLLKV